MTTAHLVLTAVTAPASGEDARAAAARGLREALEMLGVPDGETPPPGRLAALAS